MQKLPPWLIKKVPKQENIRKIRALLNDENIHTVCESAKCPNIGECFSNNALTFMILGNVCTRNCAFCGVEKGVPLPVDVEEPKRIAEAVRKLNLEYVVITSVTRDDLEDGGAGQFAKVVRTIRNLRLNASVPNKKNLGTARFTRRFQLPKIEVLIPDFKGDIEALRVVIDSDPYVINHNVETIPRLYSIIRPQADYQRSLEVLRFIKKCPPKLGERRRVYTKSGFMVGLGETDQEIAEVLQDLRSVECDIVTIGQYLAPAKSNVPVDRYVSPETFDEYKKIAQELGFLQVHAGPFVRSSYQAWKKQKGLKNYQLTSLRS